MAPKKKIIEAEDLDDLFALFATPDEVVDTEPEIIAEDLSEVIAMLDLPEPTPAPAPSVEAVVSEPIVEVPNIEAPTLEMSLVEAPTVDIPIGLKEMPPPRPSYILDRARSRMGLDCGHTNFKMPEKKIEAARKKGFCCPAQMPSKAADMYSTGMPVSWRDLNGVYIRPVPIDQRRALDTQRKPSKQGLCCDADGWYIGGLTNHCVSDRPEGAPLCTAHRPQTEPPQEVIEITLNEPETKQKDQPKKTTKQRQMEARKKKG